MSELGFVETESRLKGDMTVYEMIGALSEGNPGAVTICTVFFTETPKIDPEAAFGGISYLMLLDSFGIYGSKIWMLFKDVCKQDIVKTTAVLRACQLGLPGFTQQSLHRAIDNLGEGIDPEEALTLVKERLDLFDSASVSEAETKK